MALYWPKEKVVLDIVDDPYRRPFEGDDSYTVLRVTSADLCNYDSYKKIMGRLCELLGRDMPSVPGWDENMRVAHTLVTQGLEDELIDGCFAYDDECVSTVPDGLSNVQILATSEEEGELMRCAARENGQYVRGVSVWEGPIPKNSFEVISDSTRMSTPEYFFLRKANQLPFAEAVQLGIELCGKYRTVLTQYDRGEGYDFLKRPRTTKEKLRHYLRDIRGTKEGKRAKRVLRHVIDECSSPVGAFLYLMLCLPRSQGGYGLERAQASCVFESGDGLMPASHGDFLAYDLCWPKKLVAIQYTGKHHPSTQNFKALTTDGMRVICVTDSDLSDAKKFDAIAHKVARMLNADLGEPTPKWLDAHKRLCRQVSVPTFDHMRLTMQDLSEHRAA